MKQLLLGLAILFTSNCIGQCPMIYCKKNFTQVEYYTSDKDSLKLLRTTYSNNNIEITQNTYDNSGDLFMATGNLVSGEKYVGYIKEYQCTQVAGYKKYLLYTNDGKTTDTWTVYFSQNNEVVQCSLINSKNNMVLTFR